MPILFEDTWRMERGKENSHSKAVNIHETKSKNTTYIYVHKHRIHISRVISVLIKGHTPWQ